MTGVLRYKGMVESHDLLMSHDGRNLVQQLGRTDRPALLSSG